MSNMTLECEFVAGTDIGTAIAEAKVKARHLRVAYMTFNLNGVSVSIGPNADLNKAVVDFEKQQHKAIEIRGSVVHH